MNKERLVVFAKEFARLVVFALPGLLIQMITNDPIAATTYGGLILGALKSIDRSIHEDKTLPAKGILPF